MLQNFNNFDNKNFINFPQNYNELDKNTLKYRNDNEIINTNNSSFNYNDKIKETNENHDVIFF